MAWGKDDEKQDRQRRVRAQLVDPSDSSSAYRALEVLDQLQTQPDEQIQTLADIPDYCLQRYADRETLGVREIRDVEDEEQPNGKVFKKVSSLIVTRHTVDLCLSLSVSFSSSSWVNISSALIEKLTVASRPSVEAFFHSVSDTMTRYSSSRRHVPNGYWRRWRHSVMDSLLSLCMPLWAKRLSNTVSTSRRFLLLSHHTNWSRNFKWASSFPSLSSATVNGYRSRKFWMKLNTCVRWSIFLLLLNRKVSANRKKETTFDFFPWINWNKKEPTPASVCARVHCCSQFSPVNILFSRWTHSEEATQEDWYRRDHVHQWKHRNTERFVYRWAHSFQSK